MTFYHCAFNGKHKLIEALSLSDAEKKFEEKFGFYPSPDIVDITVSKVRPLSHG